MSGIKITPADKYFSLCIRERVDFTCERCGHRAPEDKSKRLDCSHWHGRGKWSVRYDADNCSALCMGCHLYFTSHPIEHFGWMKEKLGPYRFDALNERAQNTTLGRTNKREVKLIAKHYKDQLEIMRTLRQGGREGRIEFVSW